MDKEAAEASRAKVRGIIRVAVILSVATLAEFAIAFTMASGHAKNFIFIVLTLIKAFYIVGAFMHLAHETRALITSILFPLVLVALLLFVLIHESAHIVHAFPAP